MEPRKKQALMATTPGRLGIGTAWAEVETNQTTAASKTAKRPFTISTLPRYIGVVQTTLNDTQEARAPRVAQS